MLPAKNSTLATVAGATGVAVALSDTTVPEVTDAPALGAVSATVGAVTLTLTIADVTVVPAESVTRAVRAKIPDVAGDQVTVNGALNAVPMEVVPARKSTRLTDNPPVAAAAAVMVALVPSGILVPFDGLVIDTVGSAAATVTLAADDVAVLPFESVTRAVREKVPVVVGVQSKVYGADVSVPRRVLPEKNCNCVTVAGAGAEAVAVSVVVVLTTIGDDAAKVTVGAPKLTVTLDVLEVTAAPLVSVTLAVRAEVPVALGVQVML